MPLNVQILQALDVEPLTLSDLRREVGSPPETTMRGNLRTLTELKILDRRRVDDFPGSLEFELTPLGRDLRDVLDVLGTWLARAPQGPVHPASLAAKSAVKALIEGWSNAIVRALAAAPLSLTELSRLPTGLSYPSLERRLTAMRMAGQITRSSVSGKAAPYVVSPWLRQAVAPLAAAVRWERFHAPVEAPPLTKTDVQSLLLLSVPVLALPDHLSGNCRLAVELGKVDGEVRIGGVVARIEEGRISSCTCQIASPADGWASGSPLSWLRALINDERAGLEVGGNCELASALLDGLHRSLFPVRQMA